MLCFDEQINEAKLRLSALNIKREVALTFCVGGQKGSDPEHALEPSTLCRLSNGNPKCRVAATARLFLPSMGKVGKDADACLVCGAIFFFNLK